MNRLQKTVKESKSTPILGIAVYFYDPIFLEMAARLGFRVIWIEMEHGFITFAEAADLCRMAKGTGMITMIRVADTRRENGRFIRQFLEDGAPRRHSSRHRLSA